MHPSYDILPPRSLEATAASPTGSDAVQRRIDPAASWLIGGLFACLLAFLPRSVLWAEGFVLPKEAVLHAAALGGAALQIARIRSLRFDTIDLGIGAFAVLGIVSATTVAYNSGYGSRAAAITVSGALIFWTGRTLSSDGRRDLLLVAAGLAAGLFALVALLEAYGLLGGLSEWKRMPGGTLGNRNRAAHLVVVSLPVLWAGVVRLRHGVTTAALLGCTTACTALLLLSRSRAAWLAFLVLACCAAVLSIRRLLRGSHPARRTGAFVGAVAVGIGAAVALPNALAWEAESPAAAYLDSLQRITEYQTGSGRGRLVQYAHTLEMAVDHPLLGVGPGNWPIHYLLYARANDPWVVAAWPRPLDRTPQGDWLGMAAERGFPALFLLGLSGWLLAISAWRTMTSDSPPVERSRAVALVGVLVATAVLGFLDAFLLTPAAVFYVALVLGALAPARENSTRLRLTRRVRWLSIGVVVGVTSLPLYQTIQRTRATYLVGSWFKPVEDPGRLERAAEIDPGTYEAHLLLGQHWVRQGRCDLAEPHLDASEHLFPTAPVLGRLRGRCPSSAGAEGA